MNTKIQQNTTEVFCALQYQGSPTDLEHEISKWWQNNIWGGWTIPLMSANMYLNCYSDTISDNILQSAKN